MQATRAGDQRAPPLAPGNNGGQAEAVDPEPKPPATLQVAVGLVLAEAVGRGERIAVLKGVPEASKRGDDWQFTQREKEQQWGGVEEKE